MKSEFLTEPYLLTLNPSSEMCIVWIQWQPLKGFVEFGPSSALGTTIEAECYEITGLRGPSENGYLDDPESNPPLRLWQCIGRITGLRPDERIFYRCTAGEEQTEIYHFHTAPECGNDFRFAQLSDLQTFLTCDETVYQIGCMHPDFILYSGDAIFNSWRADQWFDLRDACQDAGARKRAFFPCMQQKNGARLLQYCPIFICPGNHEMDDFRVGTDKNYATDDQKWRWSIFMQLFRPLYPDADYSLTGKRWYSVNYGDMHIASLSLQRWAMWPAYEAPGWRLVDEIKPGSPQYEWLREDLEKNNQPFTWVIQHWHLLNKGTDVQNHLCQPVTDEHGVSYPDNNEEALMSLYEKMGVNAVSYGHSHVYERYFHGSTHYIEAAYFCVCFREANAPVHPTGLLPIIEDNSRRSFLIVDRTEHGLEATGYYVNDPPIVFDKYAIADKNGKSIAP